MNARSRFTPQDEEAGAVESFVDAALYDFEYRRRRDDIAFYRRLAAERMRIGRGPILDLACGTGRVLVPLLRDGHRVVGVDLSSPMLVRAAARIRRLAPPRRANVTLVRADLREIAFRPAFALAVCAFHSIQHLVSRNDLLRFLRRVRESLLPDGWFAFDVLSPGADWMGRDPARRWARTAFRHPTTKERLVYTMNHVFDARRKALHMRVYYQPIDAHARAVGAERVVRLCHRQLDPAEVTELLAQSGFRLRNTFGGFDRRPLDDLSDEHIYVARPR
jgi:SAM-dependent methyltransferase